MIFQAMKYTFVPLVILKNSPSPWTRLTDIVVVGDNRQGVFRFSMKILCIINTRKSRESLQHVGYIVCKNIMV